MSILARVYYHFKTNCLRYFSFLFSFVFALIISLIFVPKMIKDKSYYKVYKSCKIDNVWFTSNPADHDCFYNFNGIEFVYYDENRSLDADVLMQIDSLEYENNTFNIDFKLLNNQCVISRNLAYEKNLKLGDSIFFYNVEYKIEKIISSQEGIDDSYYHKGVIVLSYDNSTKKPNKYICFLRNTEVVYDAERFVSISDKGDKYHYSYIINSCIYFSLSLLVIVLEELFIFRNRGNDYLIYRMDGTNQIKLSRIVLRDNIIKIFVPFVFATLVLFKYIFAYQDAYIFVLINIISFYLFLVFIDSLIYLCRRNRAWRRQII